MLRSAGGLLKHILHPLHLILLLSMFFSVALLLVRVQATGSLRYGFLLWNLFLAGLPLAAAVVLKWLNHNGTLRTWSLLVVGAFWLLFLPNAPYILTDLVHFRKASNPLIWVDLMVILSFAWNGLIMGLISLLYVQDVVEEHWNKWAGWGLALGSIVACSFGIYLGRILRWNSWDILHHPSALFNDITQSFAKPITDPSWGITLGFSGILVMAYLTLRALVVGGRTQVK